MGLLTMNREQIIKPSGSIFDETLVLDKPINDSFFNDKFVKYFDNDGFELSLLEKEYYKTNGVELTNYLNHDCNQKEWFIGGDSNLIVDHSLLLQRWSFGGEARKQLESFKTQFPQINKYLRIVPKWGLDFSLEYYDDTNAIEVLHVEKDYRSFSEAISEKQKLEKMISETDWYGFARDLIRTKICWQDLVGFDSNDWKSRFFGLTKAETTLKAFA